LCKIAIPPPPLKVLARNQTSLFAPFLIAVFVFALSGCDFIDGLLGKSDNPDTAEPEQTLATGGETVIDGDWEIHIFTQTGVLEFVDRETTSATADYLIVAGGGGSGGDHPDTTNTDYAGGGGAGGLLYRTEVNQPLEDGIVLITVGAGGEGGQKGNQGANGGDSAVGDIVVPGGGGGGSGKTNMDGRSGGSGGAGGAGSGVGSAGIRFKDIAADIKGNDGGKALSSTGIDRGAGGGGAESAGQNATSSAAGAGGSPWVASEDNASWITTVTKTAEFSQGGSGGHENSIAGGIAGIHYGDGGSAGKNTQQQGGSGHDGIVVIRFQRPVAQ
jgi:hypothetical protein